eukprot:1109521-Alexandrium_andersonii.AAC.1
MWARRGEAACMRARRSCVRVGEAKLRRRVRGVSPPWLWRTWTKRFPAVGRDLLGTGEKHIEM